MSNRTRIWRILRTVLLTIIILLLMLLAYGYFIGSRNIVVHEQTLYFDDLPDAFDGYRICQFTDLHIATFNKGHKDDVDSIISKINSQNCDMIAFVGDAVNKSSGELDGYRRKLSKLSAPDGVFSVLGNHDYGLYYGYENEDDRLADIEEMHRKQRSYGWNLLLNEHRFIHRGNDSIAIVGVENWGTGISKVTGKQFPQYGDIHKAGKGIKKSDFCILLSHDPTHWRAQVVPQTSFQLTLAGHTHGGQFKIFGWSPCQMSYSEWSGIYMVGKQILNVSEGVGNSIIPFRFGAWPEINVITLKVKSNK